VFAENRQGYLLRIKVFQYEKIFRMPRQKSHKFWQIEVKNNSFTLKVGTVGAEPKIRFIEFSTEERAFDTS